MSEIHVGDVGTSFRATIKDEDGTILNVSTATTLLMWFGKPNEDGTMTVVQKTATLFTNGTDGVIEYITQAGDLDRPGNWKAQGVVGFPGGNLNHSDIHKFKVFANLQ